MKSAPWSVRLLALLLGFQSLGALFGGIFLVASPSGEWMHMPLSMLDGSPFRSFLVPGLILGIVLGIFPGFLAWAVIRRPALRGAGLLNLYSGTHWAWAYSLYLGIMLVVWILVEIIWVAYDPLQTVYGLVGVVVLILTLHPATMRYFGWKPEHG